MDGDDNKPGPWLPWAMIAAVSVLCVCGCAGSKQTDGGQAPDVRAISFELSRTQVIESSVLEIPLQPTQTLVGDSAQIRIDGTLGGDRVFQTYGVELVRPTDTGHLQARWPMAGTVWSTYGAPAGKQFQGTIEIRVFRGDTRTAVGRVTNARLQFQSTPLAELGETGLTGERRSVHVNERVAAQMQGVLSPDEGATVAVVESGSVQPDGGETRSIAGETLPIEWAGSRDRGSIRVDPAVFGVQSGTFEATVRLENRPRLGDTVRSEQMYRLRGRIQESLVATLTPGAASRGQFVTIEGRGFVPNNSDAGYGMILRYEGSFHPADDSASVPIDAAVRPEGGSAPGADGRLERSPEQVVAEDQIRQPVWFRVTEDRKLAGLGRRPGRFDGTITPVLFDSEGEQVGQSWEGTFRLKPTKQVMYVKFLPVFSRALEAYGLRNVERQIRQRVLTVIRETYAPYHVEVTEEPPTEWSAFATIEVGGADPTGTRAFGFDNSFNGVAKDTGNLFLADYLGGVNAEAAEAFNNPYGGIFLNSFSYFSNELNPDSPGSTEAFDRIFSPFMPELGGEPVSGSEWPAGSRAPAIEAAIDAMGNVVGNTAAHEFGHSMGMTFVEQDRTRPTDIFHNQIPGPYVMDGGADRPFDERAELPGATPVRFNERNREYLERIIPTP
jgi:hypothetical protein